MLTLIKNVDLFSPQPMGQKDILVADRRIAAIEDKIDLPESLPGLEIVDARGLTAVPGFVDNHVHITGGGGEGGFDTRTPELEIKELIKAGVTTVIGVRGTDGFSRSMQNLVAKAKSIRKQGFSCWILTGSYQVPVRTLTGSIESDIMMVEEIIGTGEIAVADHRSSHPGIEDLLSLASSTRVGGMLSGKSGVVNLHLGDGEKAFDIVKAIVNQSDIPVRQLVPTHVNRNYGLLCQAYDWAKSGGFIDMTASGFVAGKDDPRTRCSRALIHALELGVPIENVSFSSDGQGSLPIFGPDNQICGAGVGTCSSLIEEVRDLVLELDTSLETALRPVTQTPSEIYGLPGKGRLIPSYDADILLLDHGLNINRVMSGGIFYS